MKDREKLKIEDESLNLDILKSGGELSLYIQDIIKYPVLTYEEEKSEMIKYKVYGSEEAREKLINCNLRLVISVAKKHIRRNQTTISIKDLVQEGNIGLINAIEKFDLNKDTRLSTYAVPWIKQRIKRYINTNLRYIRIPDWMANLRERFLEYQENYIKKNQTEPSDQQYLDYLHITKENLKDVKKSLLEIRSLDAILPYADFDEPMIEQISDSEILEDELIKNINEEIFWKKVRSILSQRQFDIILKRYGKKIDNMGSDCIETLKEIAEEYNITDKMVHNIEKRAIKQLVNSKKFDDYR